MQSWIFSSPSSSLKCLMIFHKSFQYMLIWFPVSVENSENIFPSLKEQQLFEIDFCNNVKIYCHLVTAVWIFAVGPHPAVFEHKNIRAQSINSKNLKHFPCSNRALCGMHTENTQWLILQLGMTDHTPPEYVIPTSRQIEGEYRQGITKHLRFITSC